jgi:hypothetical protein
MNAAPSRVIKPQPRMQVDPPRARLGRRLTAASEVWRVRIANTHTFVRDDEPSNFQGARLVYKSCSD